MNNHPTITRTKPITRSNSSERPVINYSETRSKKTPTSNKRKANSSPTKLSPESKKSTTTKMSITADDIQKMLNNQTETLQSNIQRTIKHEMKILGDEIKANLDAQIAQINARIDSMQNDTTAQLNAVRADVFGCTESLKLNEEDTKRISKLNELRLKGIAHTNGENLKDVFLSIAQVIGFDTSNPLHIPEVSRSFIKNRQNNELVQLPNIVMKFVAKHIRNQFYGLYLARLSQQPLLSEHINLPQGGRIIIAENLTPHNQSIFNAAMNLKREKKLVKVNTVDGLVFIKINTTDKMTCIKLLRELDLHMAKSSTSELQSANSIGPNLAQHELVHNNHQQQHQQLPNANQSTQHQMDLDNHQH